MLEKLKKSLEKSQESLEEVVDKLDDRLEDVGEDAIELWQQTKPKLQHLKEVLSGAAKTLHTQTDEARLQAHLATMDAADQWSHLSHTVTELAQHTQSKGQSELQHANLQAHLAKMEARDFINTQGEEIRRDYKLAKEKVEQASQHAAESLEKSFQRIGEGFVGPFV